MAQYENNSTIENLPSMLKVLGFITGTTNNKTHTHKTKQKFIATCDYGITNVQWICSAFKFITWLPWARCLGIPVFVFQEEKAILC